MNHIYKIWLFHGITAQGITTIIIIIISYSDPYRNGVFFAVAARHETWYKFEIINSFNNTSWLELSSH